MEQRINFNVKNERKTNVNKPKRNGEDKKKGDTY